MNRLPADFLAVAALMLVLVMAAWLGVAGPVFDDVQAKGVLQTLQGWQGLVGAVIALAAALVAIQPIRRQLHQLQEQNSYLKLEYLRRQTVELDREELLTLKLISSILAMASKAVELSGARLPFGVGHTAADVQEFKNGEAHMNDAMASFMQDVGSLWGSFSLRAARRKLIANAQQFSRHVGDISGQIAPGRLLEERQYQRMRADLLPVKDRIQELGNTIRAAILQERSRVVAQIEALEKLLR